MRNWAEWHQAYEQPGSSLARRLEVVRDRLRDALGAAGPSPTILSLCSGDGRDVIGVLIDHPAKVGRAVLVERDQGLAERARQAASSAGLGEVEVRGRDAGLVESFADVLPVEVLLLCGVFGNIDHEQVRTVVGCIPRLLRAGGYVIWTRGGSTPDRRPEVRTWFTDAGLEELSFDGAPEPYGVGLNRLTRPRLPSGRLPERLFSFR